jgi:hypothetical protein
VRAGFADGPFQIATNCLHVHFPAHDPPAFTLAIETCVSAKLIDIFWP